MPPGREAVQRAARQAAVQASAVFRAVVNGPEAPVPAGVGVDLRKFQEVLPWFGPRELVTFANYFGQRRAVVSEIGGELALEVSRRLRALVAASAGNWAPSASEASHWARATAGGALSPREVAALAYSFSKISPQLPECVQVYDAIADGITQNVWSFSRLQAALVGTALADAQHRLQDALPRLLRPILQGLAEDSTSPGEELVLDELRYLLHAVAHLDGQHLTARDVEVLAACTRRLIERANFANAAHLLVSWLQLHAPPEAKEAYLAAMLSVCDRLSRERPWKPAHPLPEAGLAPILGRLLAREEDGKPPPLTPPKLRGIIHALVQITRGLHLADSASARGRSLSFSDWAHLLQHVANFCDAHRASLLSPADLASHRLLPAWAAEAFGFVYVAVPRHHAAEEPPDIEALLLALRLLRSYRPHPAPDRRFFLWVAEQLEELHRRLAADRQGCPAALAEAIGELVPRLPDGDRARLARMLLAGQTAGLQSPGGRASSSAAILAPQLLAGGSGATSSPKRISVSFVPERGAAARPARLLTSPPAALAVARSQARRSGSELWGLLAEQPSEAAAELHEGPRLAAAAAQEQTQPCLAPPRQDAGTAASFALAVEAKEEKAGPEAPASAAAAASPVAAGIHELQSRLEIALARVEALEARLSEREARTAEAPATPAAEARSDTAAGGASDIQCQVSSPLAQESRLEGWFPGAFMPGGTTQSSSPLRDRRMALPGVGGRLMQFNRPFSFDEYRRAQSPRLQPEKVRVRFAPDNHFRLVLQPGKR